MQQRTLFFWNHRIVLAEGSPTVFDADHNLSISDSLISKPASECSILGRGEIKIQRSLSCISRSNRLHHTQARVHHSQWPEHRYVKLIADAEMRAIDDKPSSSSTPSRLLVDSTQEKLDTEFVGVPSSISSVALCIRLCESVILSLTFTMHRTKRKVVTPLIPFSRHITFSSRFFSCAVCCTMQVGYGRLSTALVLHPDTEIN